MSKQVTARFLLAIASKRIPANFFKVKIDYSGTPFGVVPISLVRTVSNKIGIRFVHFRVKLKNFFFANGTLNGHYGSEKFKV